MMRPVLFITSATMRWSTASRSGRVAPASVKGFCIGGPTDCTVARVDSGTVADVAAGVVVMER